MASVEVVLTVAAAAAAAAPAAEPAATAGQVDAARDQCLAQLAALRAATEALPAALPAPSAGGADPALAALRERRDALQQEVAAKNEGVKATLDAMRDLQADITTIQTQAGESTAGEAAS